MGAIINNLQSRSGGVNDSNRAALVTVPADRGKKFGPANLPDRP